MRSEVYASCPWKVDNTRVDDCPSTPTADAVLNVTRWPLNYRDSPALNALHLKAGTYRAVICFRYNNPKKGIPRFNGKAVWFYPDGENTNETYWTNPYEFLPVSILGSANGEHEAEIVVPHTDTWKFQPGGLIDASWRLSLWRTG